MRYCPSTSGSARVSLFQFLAAGLGGAGHHGMLKGEVPHTGLPNTAQSLIQRKLEDSLIRTQNITVRLEGVLCVLMTLCCDLSSTAERLTPQ